MAENLEELLITRPAVFMVMAVIDRMEAQEMRRRSNKRREMDVDYEEKKSSQSLTKVELEENDYYTRPTSLPPTFTIRTRRMVTMITWAAWLAFGKGYTCMFPPKLY